MAKERFGKRRHYQSRVVKRLILLLSLGMGCVSFAPTVNKIGLFDYDAYLLNLLEQKHMDGNGFFVSEPPSYVRDESVRGRLHRAVYNGNVDELRLLLNTQELGDINTIEMYSEETGFSCLMQAVQNGHEEVVRMLLNAGADINAVDGNGSSGLLHVWTIKYHNTYPLDECKGVDMTKLLIKAGASVNVVSLGGYTPLIRALVGKEADVARALILTGARVDVLSHDDAGFTLSTGQKEFMRETLKRALADKRMRAVVEKALVDRDLYMCRIKEIKLMLESHTVFPEEIASLIQGYEVDDEYVFLEGWI